MPLQQTVGVGERALLLGVRGSREEEHLGADVLRSGLARLDFRSVLPERRALDEGEVPHDEPVQLPQTHSLHPGVGRSDSGVLAQKEVALAPAGELFLDGVVRAVRTGDPRQVVEAEVVALPGCVPPVRLEQADQIRLHVGPEPSLGRVGLDELPQVLVPVGVRHRDVARQQVEQRGDVARPLDAGVPTQRHHPAARAADVAQQQLQNAGGADVLRAGAVLGPPDRVGEGAGPLTATVGGQCVGDLSQQVRRHPTDPLDHLRGVPGVMAAQGLEDACEGPAASRRVPGCPSAPAPRNHGTHRGPTVGPTRRSRRRAPRTPPRPASPGTARSRRHTHRPSS